MLLLVLIALCLLLACLLFCLYFVFNFCAIIFVLLFERRFFFLFFILFSALLSVQNWRSFLLTTAKKHGGKHNIHYLVVISLYTLLNSVSLKRIITLQLLSLQLIHWLLTFVHFILKKKHAKDRISLITFSFPFFLYWGCSLVFSSTNTSCLHTSLLLALAVGLGGVVAAVHNQILRAVVEAAAQVAVQNGLGAVGVALLGIQGSTRHVGDHGVSATKGVLGVAQDVVLGCRLGEPDITTVAAQVAALEGLGDVLLDDNGATGRVDEPRAGLHLGNQLLVEQTARLLVQGAVDGDDVALGDELLQGIDAAAANLLLDLVRQRLVVVVEQLLAVKGLEAAQDTLADAADSDGADNLALQVKLVLGGLGDVPVTALNHLVGGDEVADEQQDGHDDVLSDGDDVGAGDLGDGDTAVGLVGGIEVDVVGANTGGDGELQVLGLGEALSGQVTRVEAVLLEVTLV